MSKNKILPKLKVKKKIRKKKGKAPGTILYVGQREGQSRYLSVIGYAPDRIEEHRPEGMEEILKLRSLEKTTWINIVGISDEAFVEKLGPAFNINSLVLEDAINTQQRPKIDEYDDYIFGVFRMIYMNGEHQLVGEHVALLLFSNAVILLQEMKEDVFDGVRERIRNSSGRIRNRNADYLFFALIDAIVDNYFEVLDHIFERIEALEDEVYKNPNQATAQKIQELKKEIIKLHKQIFPVRDLVHRLIDTENKLIAKDTKLFLRDVLDHCIEINESLQFYREMSISLMEMYMSNVSNKMNEVMKVLTIMASIFIPLTFLAGIYGMNFEYMPELGWHYGYFVVLGCMFLIIVGMLIFFKRKGWL